MKRSNGYGTVRKLSGKRRKPWTVIITVGWTEDGKQQRKYIGYYKTKGEAEIALAEYHTAPEELNGKNTTLAELYNKWQEVEMINAGESRIRQVRSAWSRLTALYSRPIASIKPSEIQKILNLLEVGYSSVKHTHSLLNQLYTFAVADGLTTSNPMTAVKVTQKAENKTEKTVFSREEWTLISSEADKGNFSAQVLKILLYTGLRIGELLSLRLEDVHLAERYMYIRSSKTENGVRNVPISSKIMPILEGFVKSNKTNLIELNNRPVRYETFAKNYVLVFFRQFGMKHTIHETRHSCITELVRANANQTIIKKIVGHTSLLSLTEAVYTHIDVADMLTVIELLP